MMTKKDRAIANEKAKVKNRDKLIKNIQEEKEKLKNERLQLIKILATVEYLATSNVYGNEKIRLNKIKEIVTM